MKERLTRHIICNYLFIKICLSIFPVDVWDKLTVLIRPVSGVFFYLNLPKLSEDRQRNIIVILLRAFIKKKKKKQARSYIQEHII